jgi:hypothetical protein
MGLKINIGCGFRKFDGFVNLDADPQVNPDHVVDFEKDKLPFDDNSVEYVWAMHILEHMGDGFFHLMKEIYRVCNHGAGMRIVGPHHRHDDYYMDPTHKRPINHPVIQHFDKSWCDLSKRTNNSSSGMAYVFDVDFRIVNWEYTPDPFYQGMYDDMLLKFNNKEISQEEYNSFLFQVSGINNFYQFFKADLIIHKQ